MPSSCDTRKRTNPHGKDIQSSKGLIESTGILRHFLRCSTAPEQNSDLLPRYTTVMYDDSIRFDSIHSAAPICRRTSLKRRAMWRYRHVSDILEAKDEYKTAKNEKKY